MPGRSPPAQLWRAVIDAAAEHGGAIPVVETPQLSRADGSLAPGGLVAVQTPQAFRAPDLLAAYRRADADGFVGTDTAACLERYADVVDRRRAEHDGQPQGDLPRGHRARRGAARPLSQSPD